MVTKSVNQRSPETNTKRTQIVLSVKSIALDLGHLKPKFLGLAAQSPRSVPLVKSVRTWVLGF